jgi:membrane peptidoglycan carboxypeptidase
MRTPKPGRRFLRIILATVLTGTFGLPAAGCSQAAADAAIDHIDVSKIQWPPARQFRPDNPITDITGQVVLSTLPADNDNRYELDSITAYPEILQHAVVAAEDVRFYQYKNGVDARSIGRAVARQGSEGASTLPMQWVNITFLNPHYDARDRTSSRKILQAELAIKLERELTAYFHGDRMAAKGEELKRYLNDIYLCNHAVGFEAASRAYFGHGVGKLTVGQAATLAAIIRRPCDYTNPDNGWPAQLQQRRDQYVLPTMLKQKWITQDEYAAALKEPIGLNYAQQPPRSYFNSADPYLSAWVLQDLRQRYPDSLGPDQSAQGMLAHGGVVIQTTLDARMHQSLPGIVQRFLPNPGLAVGLTDFREDGSVKAFYGGDKRRFGQDQNNYAFQGPGQEGGSTAKVFTLLDFIRNGYSADKSIIDVPAAFPVKGAPPITNAPREPTGKMSVTRCTVISSNTCFLELITGTRPGGTRLASNYPVNPQSTAKLMGPTLGGDSTLIPGVPKPAFKADPTLTLGKDQMTTVQRGTAFQTILRHGKKVPPWYLKAIKTDSGPIYEYQPVAPVQAVPAKAADQTLAVLQQVVNGTGAGLNIPGHDAAMKTGTGGDGDGDKSATFIIGTGIADGAQSDTCSISVAMPHGGVLPANSSGNSVGRVCKAIVSADLPASLPNVPLAPNAKPDNTKLLVAP